MKANILITENMMYLPMQNCEENKLVYMPIDISIDGILNLLESSGHITAGQSDRLKKLPATTLSEDC